MEYIIVGGIAVAILKLVVTVWGTETPRQPHSRVMRESLTALKTGRLAHDRCRSEYSANLAMRQGKH